MIRQGKDRKRESRQESFTFDLVVVGGGLSGVCCSLAAARNGCKVALIQDRPVLGGNASSEVRVWALGATSHMGNNNRWAREGGIIDEIMVENLYRNREGNPLLFDALLLDKVMNEPNISLFLNTVVYDVAKSDNDTVSQVTAFNPQNQTRYLFSAPYFCDASGDGILSYLAGASYRMGAEDCSEFKEGFSPSADYGELLGHTIFLYTKRSDQPVNYVAPSFALKDMTAIPKLHQITPDQYGCNYWWFEYGGNKDTIYDCEDIKFELWRVVYGAWDHIKNSGLYPEAANLTLEWVGVIPGKRESRRFEGLYMLTQHDIVEQTEFPDAVAYGGWAIDLHPAEGVYSSAPSCNQYHSEGVYSIPYRCYVSKDISNLYIVGRLISVSHVAFGSTRVMITSALGGQAIGCAAAMCKEKGCLPADLLEPAAMAELQNRLSLMGQSIPHVSISADSNLLSSASLQASSTLSFDGFPFDGDWRCLEMSMGELLSLKHDTKYQIEVEVKADAPTELTVDLMVSQKPFNYTPNRLLESKQYHLEAGSTRLTVEFTQMLDTDSYAFILFRRNEHVSLRTSRRRVTGILSVFNKFNKAVNNLGRQLPPEGSGFKEFEFFTPERRPCGQNIAFRLTPSLDCYAADQVCNGYIRPFLRPNAWVAGWEEDTPELVIDFGEPTEVHGLRLYFDTDYDHPMETIQWNHPESVMPFCVQQYCIYDDSGKEVFCMTDNHQTINVINFQNTLYSRYLRLVFKRNNPDIPVALFQIVAM